MTVDISNPYVGLRPFDVDESILFFGRNEQALELLECLHKFHFVAVVGSSGSGKSSLLRAGLIPGLKAGYLVNDRDHWLIAIMKPGQSPLYNLAESILLQLNTNCAKDTVNSFLQQIKEEGADAVLKIIQPLWKEKNVNFFLLVDQFEELFRFTMEQKNMEKKDEAIDFVNSILELSQQADIPFYVVITMRSDFIGDCTQFYGLPEAMNKSQYLVPRITRAQLKTVIEGPAKLYGSKINPQLSSSLINELNKIKDELPLLQHTLMRMWDKMVAEDKHALDLEDYKKIGGIEEALSNHADEALVGMSDKELSLTKKIFQALSAIDEGGRKIRRPVLLSQLQILTGASEQEIFKIIDLFNKEKRNFIVINKAHDGIDNLIDISHESLIRQWKTLCKWVEEEGESAANYLQLAQATKLYQQKRKDLLSGSELRNTLEWYNKFKPVAAWANRYKAGFKESEAYLKESEKAEISEQDAEKKRRKKRRTFTLRMMAIITIAAIAFLITTIYAVDQKIITTRQYKAFLLHAKAKEIVNDPTTVLDLEAAAMAQVDTISIITKESIKVYRDNSFYKAVINHGNTVFGVAFSITGDTILTGSGDNTACFWDKKGNILVKFEGHLSDINTVAFSPDDKTIVTGSKDNTARLWDLKGHTLATFKGHGAEINRVVFSPDGKTILTCSDDSTARLWSLDGSCIQKFKGHTDCVNTVAFSRTGDSIFTASRDGSIRIWNVKAKQLNKFDTHAGSVNCIAISIDNTIASGSEDGTVRLWDVKGKLLQQLKGHTQPIYAVAFSKNGKNILTGSGDRTARLWGLDGITLETLLGHGSDVNAVAFSPSGNTFLTGSDDKTARLWDRKEVAPKEYNCPNNGVTSVAFSNINNTILTGYKNNTARMWNINGDTLQTFKGHVGSVLAVAFSPNGKLVLTGSADKTARLWNTHGDTIKILKGHADSITAVAFSPDGKTILTGSADKTACLWRLNGEKMLSLKGHTQSTTAVAFSPDGSKIATASTDSTVFIWDLKGNKLAQLKGHSGGIYAVAFSPNGQLILTGSADNTARLWDLQGAIVQTFNGYQDSIFCVAFSPDGKTILTGSADRKIHLWDLQGNALQEFKGHSGCVTSLVFLPNGTSFITGSRDKTARLWQIQQSLKSFLASDKIIPLSAQQKNEYGIE